MNESTQLDKLSLLADFIRGQVRILENIIDDEDHGRETAFTNNNFIKGSVCGAIDSMAAEAGDIADWLRNREGVSAAVDAAVEDFFSDKEVEPEKVVADKLHAFWNEGGWKVQESCFTASSAHDYGTEQLAPGVTKETTRGYNIIGPDNTVRFQNISKTFVKMIRDSPYAQTEQLWVAKEGLVVPGVIGVMKIEDFK